MLRVKGERGVVDPEGEEEAEVVVLPKPDWDRNIEMAITEATGLQMR